MKKLLFNDTEISGIIGISRSTLQSWRWKGCGPRFKKIGGKVLYEIKELNEFLDSHPTIQSTSQYQNQGVQVDLGRGIK
ncbi:helix-turn-helix domain-containing protein [bacterium]|jgi:hypothetical protein|nr:helix-turn-helix domain-containing protein [bacterium]